MEMVDREAEGSDSLEVGMPCVRSYFHAFVPSLLEIALIR
jgi:hypothetical protein